MEDYKIIVEQEHSTVMAQYEVTQKAPEGYQSEAKLEKDFIEQLQKQGYEVAKVKNEADLLRNLRYQLEQLNDVVLKPSSGPTLTLISKLRASNIQSAICLSSSVMHWTS